jgi:hypothetical protein
MAAGVYQGLRTGMVRVCHSIGYRRTPRGMQRSRRAMGQTVIAGRDESKDSGVRLHKVADAN